LSEEIQQQFRNPNLDTIHVAADVQKKVVSEFGFQENEEEMLGMIRAAPALYPACPEVRRIPHYQKFNRSANGNLKPGDTIPNVALARLNGTPISLYDYIDTSCPELSDKTGKIRKPLVIAAGSYT